MLTSSAQTNCDADRVRPLRFRYLWLFGGLCLIALVLNLTLTPPGPAAGLLNDKIAHAIAFMVLMSWFCGVFEMRFAPLIGVVLLCIGILIELAQQQLSFRSAELADGLADAGGILVGWGLAVAGLQRWTAVLESWVTWDRS